MSATRILVLIVAILIPLSNAQAALRPATEADLAAMRAAGIQNPTVGMLWDSANSHVGQQAGAAKQYLKSLMKPVTSCTPAEEQINRINSAFANCAEQFLKAYQAGGGTVQITRGYNTEQCETDMCKRGPPGVGNVGCGALARVAVSGGVVRSNHTAGVAMDVVADGLRDQNQRIAKFARENPKYGVCFPFVSGPGSWDPVHMILAAGGGGEARSAGCTGVTKVCEGTSFDPNEIQRLPTIQTASQPPTAGPQRLADTIRQYTNPPANTLGTSQPLSPVSQNTIASIFAMPATTTTLANTGTTASTTGQASSTIDILTTISLGASDIATSTSITNPSVTINSGDVVFLNPNVIQNLQNAQGQFILDPTFPASQTFTSPDLNPSVPQPTQNLSTIEATIRDIRTRLDSIFQYVRPYGAVHRVTPFTY